MILKVHSHCFFREENVCCLDIYSSHHEIVWLQASLRLYGDSVSRSSKLSKYLNYKFSQNQRPFHPSTVNCWEHLTKLFSTHIYLSLNCFCVRSERYLLILMWGQLIFKPHVDLDVGLKVEQWPALWEKSLLLFLTICPRSAPRHRISK